MNQADSDAIKSLLQLAAAEEKLGVPGGPPDKHSATPFTSQRDLHRQPLIEEEDEDEEEEEETEAGKVSRLGDTDTEKTEYLSTRDQL